MFADFDISTLDKSLILFIIVTYCIGAAGKYFLFHKIGENGYNGVVPVYSDYILFGKCWNDKGFIAYLASFAAVIALPYFSDFPESLYGLVSMAFCMVALLYSIKLARSFGKGYLHLILVCIIPAVLIVMKFNNLYVFFSLFTNPILLAVLGFSKSAKYIGNASEM